MNAKEKKVLKAANRIKRYCKKHESCNNGCIFGFWIKENNERKDRCVIKDMLPENWKI